MKWPRYGTIKITRQRKTWTLKETCLDDLHGMLINWSREREKLWKDWARVHRVEGKGMAGAYESSISKKKYQAQARGASLFLPSSQFVLCGSEEEANCL